VKESAELPPVGPACATNAGQVDADSDGWDDFADRSIVAHVLPLTSGARRKAGVSYAATAAVFIRKAALDLPSPPEAVASEFKLTPAEVRVLFAIVEIGGVPEVAPALGISDQTVKTHLHRIYEKTTTKRQADLVRLVASYAGRL
jgi:DNA-binding CsgD family transcriptional regulator